MKALEFNKLRVSDKQFDCSGVEHFVSVGTEFSRCVFEGLDTTDAGFGDGPEPSLYRDCVFRRMRLRHLIPGVSRFENCTFDDVRIGEMFSHYSSFVGCRFSGKVKKGVVHGSLFEGGRLTQSNEIRDNDFRDLQLDDFDFRHVDLRVQMFSRGPALAVVHDAKEMLEALDKLDLNDQPDVSKKEILDVFQDVRSRIEFSGNQVILSLRGFLRRDQRAAKWLIAQANAIEATDQVLKLARS
jgi:hypothetical protein